MFIGILSAFTSMYLEFIKLLKHIVHFTQLLGKLQQSHKVDTTLQQSDIS